MKVFLHGKVKFQDGGSEDRGGHATSAASGLADSMVLDDTCSSRTAVKGSEPQGPRDQVPPGKGLFPPSFAGSVLQVEEVVGEVDDDSWEEFDFGVFVW